MLKREGERLVKSDLEIKTQNQGLKYYCKCLLFQKKWKTADSSHQANLHHNNGILKEEEGRHLVGKEGTTGVN